MDENVLSDEERRMADQFAQQIDPDRFVGDSAVRCRNAEKNGRLFRIGPGECETKDLGEVGELLSNVVQELKNFDEEEEKGFFGFSRNRPIKFKI